RGRLYRVRYKDTPRAGLFDLAKESDEQLIQRLHSPNVYFRDLAQRLLTERNTPATRAELQRLVLDQKAPRKARMHALWALIGTGRLETNFHLRLFSHQDPSYRAWAVRAAGNLAALDNALLTKGTDADLCEKIAGLARDRSPDVQLQVAITTRKP